MKSFNRQRLTFEWSRIRQMPLLTLARKTAARVLGLSLGLLLLPITAIFHLAGYRHATIFTDRIGHLALEPDCLIKEQILGHVPARKWIILAPPDRVANDHLLTYWQPYFTIVRNKVACFVIANVSRWGLMRYGIDHYARTIGKPQESHRIYAEWGDRPPLLALRSEDQEWADLMMLQIGLPANAWFVCIHTREGGFSPIDEGLHSHRNSHIANTVLAIEEVTRRGGWVIRIGDPTTQPLMPMQGVIDYAHHPIRSHRFDIVLCARARFILGTTSGIALVGTVFGVPCAMANLVPTADLWYGPRDISIPKLLWSEKESRYLTLAEAMQNPTGGYRYTRQYVDAGLRPTENSPEDIRDLVIEMFSRLNGTFFPDTFDIALSQEFRQRITEISPAYFSQAAPGIGFLRKYAARGSSATSDTHRPD